MIFISILTLRGGKSDIERKFKHLQALTRSLLPKRTDSPELSATINDLISCCEPASLLAFRTASLNARAHDHCYQEKINSYTCKNTFRAGDIGFIPRAQSDVGFDAFVKVCNIFDNGGLPLLRSEEVTGQWWENSNGFQEDLETWPFILPNDIEGCADIFVLLGCLCRRF